MSPLIIMTVFIFGAIIASFVGVIVVRFNTGQSWLVGHSRCDACGARLGALSLLPIISFAASRGRAHCCGARLSFASPASEALLGGLFVLAYFSLGFTLALPFMFVSLALLLALVLYDLAHQILPVSILVTFIVMSVVTGFLTSVDISAFLYAVFVALLISASLASIHFFSRGRAMGFADAPLSFGLAMLVGSAAFPGFVFSFWIGAVIGIALLARRPLGSRMGVEVPFAPFLAAGFLLAYFTQWNPFTLIGR